MPPRQPSLEPPDFPASQLFLRRLAFHLVRDEARAEDLVQETWAAWAERRPKNLAEPRAWLARVLRNRAFNAQRTEERRLRREAAAARPDASEPETEGTLEAQARLIEALRTLDEPYRSTLVQRYYHDLAPKEIAGRTGTPLDTVKARLARGLKRLREDLDRRYGGDRGAWCHWLTVLDGSAQPIAIPTGSTPAGGAAPGAPLVGLGVSASPLSWLAVALLIAAGAAWKTWWPHTPEVSSSPPPDSGTVGQGEARELSREGRVPVVSEEPERPETGVVASIPRNSRLARPKAPPGLAPGAAMPRASGERIEFEWPQYAGGPDHDNYRSRGDEIQMPRVAWFVPGCAGQPTLSGGDLYSGGAGLVRIDPITGEVIGANLGLAGLLEDLRESGQVQGKQEAQQLAETARMSLDAQDPNDLRFHLFGGSPAITRDLVIVRRALDGGVVAFDRKLEKEVWSWKPDTILRSTLPGCLAQEDLFLVAAGSELVALDVRDGREVWRFGASARNLRESYRTIHMVPACADERVFFGAWNTFYALDVDSGRLLWQRVVDGAFGWTAPVVVGERVLCADRGDSPLAGEDGWLEIEDVRFGGGGGTLRALSARSGEELWKTALAGRGLSTPGIGPGEGRVRIREGGRYAVAGFGDQVVRIDLSRGAIQRARVTTGENPFGSPTEVGHSLVFGNLDGHLHVHDRETLEPRWSFRAPTGARVHDFVHTGARIFVATSVGLFCLVDDSSRGAPPPGFVLEASGEEAFEARALGYR